MKENEGCCVVPIDSGKIWDDEDRELRYATLAELLERIKDCEHELNLLAQFYAMDKDLGNESSAMWDLDNLVYFSDQIKFCWKLIDEGKYLEVNRYGTV